MEWQSVLHLAVTWEMTQVRIFAIEKLSSCASSMTKIFLGRRYSHYPWIRAGFLDLCLRDGPLTDAEGSRLDWKEILKVSRAREIIRSKVIRLNRRREWENTNYGTCPVYNTSYNPAQYTQSEHFVDILLILLNAFLCRYRYDGTSYPG